MFIIAHQPRAWVLIDTYSNPTGGPNWQDAKNYRVVFVVDSGASRRRFADTEACIGPGLWVVPCPVVQIHSVFGFRSDVVAMTGGGPWLCILQFYETIQSMWLACTNRVSARLTVRLLETLGQAEF